jgi:hypothetical protein
MLVFSDEDDELVKALLQIEYDAESQNYPFTAPAFNADAALWAAKTIYTSCQLILYRENKAEELPQLLPSYANTIDAPAILSADLCLRFLPQVLQSTKNIDPEDSLVEVAEKHIQQWHYSGIGYALKESDPDMEIISANECLLQLYTDRVIQKKDLQRAQLPLLNKQIKAAMGIYDSRFWKTLKSETPHEQH